MITVNLQDMEEIDLSGCMEPKDESEQHPYSVSHIRVAENHPPESEEQRVV
jgi:hypothetical protein